MIAARLGMGLSIARRTDRRERSEWIVLAGCSLISVVLSWELCSALGQTVVAVCFLVFLGALSLFRPSAAIVCTSVYLALLGDIRRYTVAQVGPTTADPLVLVAPIIAALLFAGAAIDRQLSLDSLPAKLIATLMAIMAVQIFNPVQGGLAVGIGGAILFMIPLTWFWIGRSRGSIELLETILYRVVVPLAVVASILGLYQTVVGFLPYEKRWIDVAGDNPLIVGTNYRPFSFFVSPAEYWHYVGIATVVLLVMFMYRGTAKAAIPSPVRLVVMPLLLSALFLSGARGPITALLLSISVVWAIRGRTTAACISRLGIALAVGIVGLLLTMSQLSSAALPPAIAPYVARQTNGFLDPGNASASTAGIHQQLFVDGVLQGFTSPFGSGLGAVTAAAAKFSDSPQTGTEVDVSNMMVSLGVAGLVYLAVTAAVLIKAVKRARNAARAADLIILGLLVYEAGQWLTGGHYAVAALVWFCIGCLDRSDRRPQRPSTNAALAI